MKAYFEDLRKKVVEAVEQLGAGVHPFHRTSAEVNFS
jgi:hypothetical protein